MKHGRMITIAAALTALAACTEAQKDDTFAIACASVSAADTGFQIYAASGKVRDSVTIPERDAVAAAQAVCDGPRPADVKTALAAVNRALKAIADATAKARVQVGAS